MAHYDFDKKFPVYGFGAVIHGENISSMSFYVNFNKDPNITGVENIIEKYKECLNKIDFSGPTFFAPIINKIIRNIKEERDILEYHVLMI